jgi:1-phosphofructokinase family hexose kinase
VILTLTPNPTIDRAVFVRGFRLNAVVRAEREMVTPSGKGVGASLVLKELGEDTLVLGLNAGWNGRLLAGMLDERGVAHDLSPAEGETRTAMVLIDLQAEAQSTISASTLHAGEAHLEALIEAVERHAPRAWGLICGGSLPPGLPVEVYCALLTRARELGLYTLLDSSDSALQEGIKAPPHVLKANLREFAALDPAIDGGIPSTAEEEVALAARLGSYRERQQLDAVVVTVGAGGAFASTAEGTYSAVPPEVEVANTAGAGDALGAGLMLARRRGAGWAEALALGTAAAASVVMNDGTAICRRGQVGALLPRVAVCSIDVETGQRKAVPVEVLADGWTRGRTRRIGCRHHGR